METYAHSESDPVLDVAVSHALLEHAARAGSGSLRLWRPMRPVLSLGRLDLRSSRSARLVALARAAGATPVRRLAGGRAAALDGGCVCVGWAEPNPRLEESSARYRLLADAVSDALGDLGVSATLGEVPGEWCPGAWSLHGPNGKLTGIAQRVIRGGAWCEALNIVERPPALRVLTERVHELLELPWRADAEGALGELLPGRPDPHGDLTDALIRALQRTWPALEQRPLPPGVRSRALQLSSEHRLA